MNTLIFIVTTCVVFLIFSLLFYVLAIRSKQVLILVIMIVAYLLSIKPYFELINFVHRSLRDKEIYIELGHASTSLLFLWYLSYLVAAIIVIFLIFKWRSKIGQNS